MDTDYNKQLDELSLLLDEWIEQRWDIERHFRFFKEYGILIHRGNTDPDSYLIPGSRRRTGRAGMQEFDQMMQERPCLACGQSIPIGGFCTCANYLQAGFLVDKSMFHIPSIPISDV